MLSPIYTKFSVSTDVTFQEAKSSLHQEESFLEDKVHASLDFNPLGLPTSVSGA